MGLKLNGATSGSIEIDVPAVAGTDTAITIPATTGGEFIVSDSNGDVNIDSGTFFVDASTNRVGIGTTSPSEILHILKNDDVGPTIQLQNSAQSVYINNLGSTGFGGNRVNRLEFNASATGYSAALCAASDIEFHIGGVNNEKGRFDSSGRLLVGTSSSAGSGDSQYALLQVRGNTTATTAAFFSLQRGEPASSITSGEGIGYILFSDNAGGTFGSISCDADATAGSGDYPGRLVFSTTKDGNSSPTERLRITNTGYIFASGSESGGNVNRIAPATDDLGYLGDSIHRWQAVYATNGTIQTSDEREKTDIQDSILGADFIRSLRPVSYRWKIGGYETTFDEDGNRVDTPVPGVRNHYGFIAQEVKQACGNADFGGWLLEDLDDPNSKQSLRLHEFIAPIVKALQEALAKIETLETANASQAATIAALDARLTALEGGAS